MRWTEGVGGGGAQARFTISRLIAPVQEKSGSLGNRMPFSFNCQPPRTVNPPKFCISGTLAGPRQHTSRGGQLCHTVHASQDSVG